MIPDPLTRHAVVAIVSLLTGIVSWWSGRSLLAVADDPVLPERLLAHRKRNRIVLLVAFACAGVMGDASDVLWAAPSIAGARLVAGYWLRRRLYDERWSLWAYASCMVRLLLAVAVFRVLLVGAPLIASAAGSFDWLAALALGVLLLAWNNRSAEIFRWFVRSKPLDHEPLLARFRAMAAASGAPDARFELVDLRGGAIANALALPSLRGSSVVYSDTLLRLLDADEAAAITAHEIAHLEHFDRARLTRLNWIMHGLIVGATASAMLQRFATDLLSATLVSAGWSVVAVAVLAWIARDRQRNETASDVRAVALCGDAEALVRALTKVYAFARLPRRWDTRMEHVASHPSLARRIRSIRAAAGTPAPATLPQPESIRSIGAGPIVTFDADRLHWQESEGVAHVLAYAQLTELRVDVRAPRATRLVALERGGRRWEAALDADEAARAQAILDRVDGRLAEPAAPTRPMPLLQAAGAIVAISAMWVGHIVVAVVALGASTRSAAAFSAAAGAAALGAAALAARQAIATGSTPAAWPSLALVVFGIALLAAAWRKRDEDNNRMVNLGMGGLGVLALGSLAVIATSGGDAVRLYQASLALPSAAILPIALAAALACKPRRACRLAAIPISVVGLMVAVAGSGTFLHAFGSDPFLVAGPRIPIVTLPNRPSAEFSVTGAVADLRLSPDGRRVAVRKYPTAAMVVTAGRATSHFLVGAPGGSFESIAAEDLVFLDDERVLTMTVDGSSTRLQALTIEGSVVWEQSIDKLTTPRLAYRRATKHWVVTGMSVDGQIASAEGTIGSADVQRRDWAMNTRTWPADAWALDGDTMLVAHRTFGDDIDEAPTPWSLALMAMLEQTETRLTRITPSGATEVATSQLDANCTDRVFNAARIVCTAFDGARTQLLAYDPSGTAAHSIGSIGGRFVGFREADGWLSGWSRGDGLLAGATWIAVDVAGRRAISIERDGRADEIVGAGRVAATLRREGASTRVRLYALDE